MAGQGTCASGAAGCLAAEQALAFVSGRLMPGERAMVEQRIAACAGCRAAVAAAQARTAKQRPAKPQAMIVDDPPVDRPVDPVFATAPLRPNYRPARDSDRPARSQPSGLALDRTAVQVSPPSMSSGPSGDPAAGRTSLDGGLAPGEVVGRYVVERPLGAGGMGVVSLARDPELRRAVVIKLVHPNMGHGEGGDELEARLRREAQAMAQVSHANVVQIFDIGRRGDRVFLAMEYIAGRTLDVWLLEQPRTADDILGVFRQAGAGLAAAHRAGLVHRDFKPSNVLVSHDGVVKVTDFGLARSFAGGGAAATRQLRVQSPGELARSAAGDPFAPLGAGAQGAPPRRSGVHAVLTEANSVVGTPAYMAPEQAAGQRIDARTDQYALALTLLDALLGQSPTRRRIAPTAPRAEIDAALERAGIAPGIRGAVIRALAEDPSARFPAIDELLRALAPPPPARPRSRWGWIAAAVGAAAVAGGAVWFTMLREAPVAACAPETPRRWIGAPRARVVAALSEAPRPFAAWDAARIAGAIDTAVDAIGTAEAARCRGAPLEGSAGSAECIARRTSKLAAAFAALSASPPPADPWRWVRPIADCDAPVSTAIALLRDHLPTATPERAREIAGTARAAGDDPLAADALEVAGMAALAGGDAVAADGDLQAMRSAGERTGDDATRGRALLHMLEVARWRGDYAIARREHDDLVAMLARHGDAPREQLTAALVAGPVFSDLGDVTTAFAAWDRARAAANELGDRDAALAAAAGRAWSTYALRLDLGAARRDLGVALAVAATASPAARAAALGVAADLAIAERDGAAAAAAMAELQRLDPGRAEQRVHRVIDRVRVERARALAGEVDAAVAALVPAPEPAPQPDVLTAARLDAGRGHALLAAGRAGEARAAFEHVQVALSHHRASPTPIAVPEHIEILLATCEAQVADLHTCRGTYLVNDLLKSLHPRSPQRARLAIAQAAGDFVQNLKGVRTQYLTTALDILVEAGAEPLQIAGLKWQIAQLGAGGLDHAGLARAAREAYRAAGANAQADAIDAWLAERPGTRPAASTREPPGAPTRRDPWGPQP